MPISRPSFTRLRQIVPASCKPLLLLLSLTAVAGCATNYGSVVFRSEPDGVQVYDLEDGSVIGVTPVRYLWRSRDAKRKYMNVRMFKEGYRDAVKAFWLSLDYSSEADAVKNPQLVQFELEQGE